MIKELSQITKIFINLYWKQTLVWIALQVLIIAIYRKLTIVTTIGEPIPQSPSKAVIFILLAAIAFSFMALLIFLGNTFSSSQRVPSHAS